MILRTLLHRLIEGWKRRVAGIDGCLAILPVLRAQIRESNQAVENAVTAVCANFAGIADRARQAVAKTAALLDGPQEGQTAATVEGSIGASRTTIASLLERMRRAADLSSGVVTRMEQVEKAVSGIELLLGEVQKIAFSNKLVALNAKIEAVHVGQLGSGFEVVADEISRQADRSSGLAEDIGTRIREMRNRVNAAAAELRALVAEDRQALSQSRGDADAALDLLLSTHLRAREALSAVAEDNRALAGDISRAVVGLQFQDRVGQCLTHVVEALEKMEHQLGGAAGAGAGGLVQDVHSSYTMESERAVLARTLSPPEPDTEGGDVELF
jgi:methyl-accepting chemotaxis protein